jgi:integrase/recombinase XerC
MQRINTKAGSNYFTQAEEKKFFATISAHKGKQATRDFFLFKFCRVTGLRRVEMARLNVGDVKNKATLVVNERIAAKGGVDDVSIPAELQQLVRSYLYHKRQWGEDLSSDAPLFVSRKGGRLAIRTINDAMSKWCRIAGIRSLTPHALRHTKAHRILEDTKYLPPDERDKKIVFVSRQLRHKSLRATGIYLQPTMEQMANVGAI